MTGHTRTVLRDVGVTLQIPGVMALVSVPVALASAEHFAVWPLLVTAAVSLCIGQTLYRVSRTAGPMGVSHAMVTALLTWTLVPLVGALPFVLITSRLAGNGVDAHALALSEWWNAVFESMSGFTSTGLSMAVRPDQLPHALQWWRSFSQWVGGVGIIVLTLSVFHPSKDARRLYFAESGQDIPTADITSTAKGIWQIYVAYTLAGIVGLRLTGLTWWQALNYGMAGIATGGFGLESASMGSFGRASQLVMLVIIVCGAISFSVHRRLLVHAQHAAVWRDTETRTLGVILAVGAMLLVLENRWTGIAVSGLDSVFQWSSALATAGFSTVPVQPWSASAKLLLCLAMTCGGAAGATTGGLRLGRVVRLVQGAVDRIVGVARHPWRLLEHKPVADPAAEHHAARQLEAAVTMLLLWAMATLSGTLLLLHAVGPEAHLDDVLFEVSSALNNVGLTTGITSPELAASGKLGLILLMLLGRLEIVPVLVLGALIWSSLPPSLTTVKAPRGPRPKNHEMMDLR